MGLAMCGIIFDVAFDFISYQHIKASDHSGRQIVRSYEILLQLQNLDRSLDQISNPPVDENELKRAQQDVATLGSLMQDRPRQKVFFDQVQELIRPLSVGRPADQKRIERAALQAGDLVGKMLLLESQSLQPQLKEDISENHKIEYSSTGALILDALLGLMMLGLFIVDHRMRRKVERNLSVSLRDIMDVNHSLEEERLKRQISLRTIVHDLKNPLGSIRGFAELMGEAESASSVQEFSERIKKISQKSLELVESILVSPGDSGAQMAPVNLVDLLSEVGRHCEGMARLKNQTLRWDLRLESAPVLGVETRLSEMFSNLIGNAIKYSPFEKDIWIRCYESADKVCVAIEDQGPGFDEEDAAKAFRYGQTLKAQPTGGESSTGFGLFIVKQIAEMHGAHPRIEKNAGGVGARIVVEFASLGPDKRRSPRAPEVIL